MENKKQIMGLSRLSFAIFVLCVLFLVGAALSLVFFHDDHAAVSRVAFQMFEVVLMILVIFLPKMLKSVADIKVPAVMDFGFVFFGFGSLILGDVVDFYGKYEWWDALQHGISGILLGILGYAIINLFNTLEGNKIRYTPIFVAVWVVCFALSIGAMWEIVEFITDGLFGLNSQQFLEGSGTFDNAAPLMGHEALRDTMEDLMLDFAGSFIVAVVGYFDLKKQRNVLLSFVENMK